MTDWGQELQGNSGWAKLTVAVLGVLALVEGAMAVSRIVTIFMLSKVQGGQVLDMAEARADDARTQGLAILYLLLLFGTALVYCIWLYRASKNAHVLSGGAMECTPGWAVGWNFVPFACLVKPFQAVVEIWKVSGNPHDPESVLYPEWLLRGWWGLWLVGNVASNVAFRFADPEHLDLYVSSLWVDIFASVCGVCASLMLAMIVRRIQAMQGDAQMVAHVFA
ncbi:DUF4328 domain-containing protein [Sphingobium sp. AP49]|uniref:DUF4328 domain-containing protein n=1 Tax=Sphingobium sp. AP49 TaxID=1144307 RepID=UPI00026ECA87|nr:DUF4328 domain-containing protein [Sphingobium sp. AP49]WHO40766.1 DUF4328 domain-containing protein [Sphingobium sp. AP49]